MNYKVDYDNLHELNENILNQSKKWSDKLEVLMLDLENLAETSNMSGESAEAIKYYLENVHMKIISSLSNLIFLHSMNCNRYSQKYFNYIDTNTHAKIYFEELDDSRKDLKKQQSKVIDIDQIIRSIIRESRDIIYLEYKGSLDVNDVHNESITFIDKLDKKIVSLENQHYSNDFVYTKELIDALNEFIATQCCYSRNYRDGFLGESFYLTKEYKALLATNIKVNSEIEDNIESFESAMANRSERLEVLESERKKRERLANIITGSVALIGAIALTVVTFGAAGPAVAIGCGALIGGITKGTSALADEYVEHGNLLENSDKVDWGECVIEATTGAIVGGFTGYIGGSFSGVTAMAPKGATGAVIRSTSSIISGASSRAITTYSETGSITKTVASVFNPIEIMYDGTTGSFVGNIGEEIVKTLGNEVIDEVSEKCSKIFSASDYEKNIQNKPVPDDAKMEKTQGGYWKL